MQRIQLEVAVTALVVLVGVAIAGTWFDTWWSQVRSVDLVQTAYVALCVSTSAALAGVAAGLKRGVSTVRGARPNRSLVRYLLPTISAAWTACIATAWASVLLATISSTSIFQLALLHVARWLDIGIFILCIASTIGIVFDFRRASVSKPKVHSH
jgi:hypothetical protein